MKLTCLPDSRLQLTDSSMLHGYIYGGNAELTMVGPAGTAHTYIISKPRNSDDFPPDIRFVYVVHEEKKFYLGMIENNKFRCTAHSRFDESSETVKGAKYLMNLAKNQPLFDITPMKLYQSGRCARCGRKLSSDKALSRGFGKKCYQIAQIQRIAAERLNADLRPYNF